MRMKCVTGGLPSFARAQRGRQLPASPPAGVPKRCWTVTVWEGGSSRSAARSPERITRRRGGCRETRPMRERGRGWECWARPSPDWKPACPGSRRTPSCPNWTLYGSPPVTFPTLDSYCRMDALRAALRIQWIWYESRRHERQQETTLKLYYKPFLELTKVNNNLRMVCFCPVIYSNMFAFF